MWGRPAEASYEAVEGSDSCHSPPVAVPPRCYSRLGQLGVACATLVSGSLVLYTTSAWRFKDSSGTGAVATGLRRDHAPGIIQMSGMFDKKSEHPINKFGAHLDSVKFEGAGLYYEFDTSSGHVIFSGQVEGKPGDWTDATTPLPLASASKLYTGMAAMVTMQLKPDEFYPEKYVNEFEGWEDFKDFSIHGTSEKANITIHQLLTHTSGLPFAMRSSKRDIAKTKLFYKPGTGFGYTLGHRIVGWLLRDFWQGQPEANTHSFQTCDDTFRFLVFDRLGLSPDTKFDNAMTTAFGYSGQAGDAAIQSTGADMMKLAVVALRKGRLINGDELINETNWDKWAMKNLLPGDNVSKNLIGWEKLGASWADWNVGGLKASIMKQAGNYGWNYFGATYISDNRVEIGWCGFFSSCLRVSYTQNVAFVMMQRDVSDLKKSKPYMVEHFDTLAKSLQCTGKTAQANKNPELPVGSCCASGSSCNGCPLGCQAESTACGIHGGFVCSDVFCQLCTESGWFSKKTSCVNEARSDSCPSNATRAKMLTYDYNMDDLHHSCYVAGASIASK